MAGYTKLKKAMETLWDVVVDNNNFLEKSLQTLQSKQQLNVKSQMVIDSCDLNDLLSEIFIGNGPLQTTSYILSYYKNHADTNVYKKIDKLHQQLERFKNKNDDDDGVDQETLRFVKQTGKQLFDKKKVDQLSRRCRDLKQQLRNLAQYQKTYQQQQKISKALTSPQAFLQKSVKAYKFSQQKSQNEKQQKSQKEKQEKIVHHVNKAQVVDDFAKQNIPVATQYAPARQLYPQQYQLRQMLTPGGRLIVDPRYRGVFMQHTQALPKK